MKKTIFTIIVSLLFTINTEGKVAKKLTHQARHDFETFIEYWGELYSKDFVKLYGYIFKENKRFTTQTFTSRDIGIYNPLYVDFSGNTVSNLKPEPVPGNLKRNPTYVKDIITGFLEAEEYENLYSNTKLLIYAGYQSKNWKLFEQGIFRFIGLYIIYFQQEQFTPLSSISKDVAIPAIISILERFDLYYTEKLPVISEQLPILFPLVQLLKYKHTGDVKDYNRVLSVFSQTEIDYKNNISAIPENRASRMLELVTYGMTIAQESPIYKNTLAKEFLNYWPSFKKVIADSQKQERKYYSELGIIKSTVRDAGYLDLADDISKLRLSLTASSKELTPHVLERLALRFWGFFTDYGTSLNRLILLFIFISTITLSGTFYNYSVKRSVLPKDTPVTKKISTALKQKGMYLKVAHSFTQTMTMKTDNRIVVPWHSTLYHSLFFLFYTLIIGQVLSMFTRNM